MWGKLKIKLWIYLINSYLENPDFFSIGIKDGIHAGNRILRVNSDSIEVKTFEFEDETSFHSIIPISEFPFDELVTLFSLKIKGRVTNRRFVGLWESLKWYPLLRSGVYYLISGIYTLLLIRSINSPKLKLYERHELLKLIIDDVKYSKGETFTKMDILHKAYGHVVFAREDLDVISAKMGFLLKSLLETNDLASRGSYDYWLTGKSLDTLSNFVQQQKRHNQNWIMQ